MQSRHSLKFQILWLNCVSQFSGIDQLGNSDWVRQGLLYYEQNGQKCPFCQQSTTEQFTQSLKDYFDEAFENDTKAINGLIAQYAKDASAIQSAVNGIIAAAVLVFLHTIGAFGVLMMVGGSIPGVTKVASIAVYEAVEAMNYREAHLMSLCFLPISYVFLLIVNKLGEDS